MLVWHDVKENPLPASPVGGYVTYFLAIHRSKNYTSDVYMCWINNGNWPGEVMRWPHVTSEGEMILPITHWAYFNLPEIDDGSPS